MADRMEQLDKVWILLDSSEQDSKESLSVETPAGFCLTDGIQSARKRLDSVCWERLSFLFTSYTFTVHGLEEVCVDGAGWVGGITMKWIGLLKIPTVALVSRSAYKAIEVFWKYARHFPRDGITCRNDRCVNCGWMTSRYCIPEDHEELCIECHNIGICRECTYVTADGRLLCGQCDVEPDAPLCLKQISDFRTNSEVCEALDYLQLCGEHFRLRDATPRRIMIAWRRQCQKHTVHKEEISVFTHVHLCSEEVEVSSMLKDMTEHDACPLLNNPGRAENFHREAFSKVQAAWGEYKAFQKRLADTESQLLGDECSNEL